MKFEEQVFQPIRLHLIMMSPVSLYFPPANTEYDMRNPRTVLLFGCKLSGPNHSFLSETLQHTGVCLVVEVYVSYASGVSEHTSKGLEAFLYFLKDRRPIRTCMIST